MSFRSLGKNKPGSRGTGGEAQYMRFGLSRQERFITTRKERNTMSGNFGDFQLGVYADAVKGVNSRYPFDFRSIQRKASEALSDWVYRYVSAAAVDGRTQQSKEEFSSSEGEAFVVTIINNGSEPVTIKSMGFKGSATNMKFRLDYLDTWRAPTGAELPKRRGVDDDPVLPVRIHGHDCHVYEYTESALLELPPDVDYHGYAQRYEAFRWWPNRPTVSKTKSKKTVLRHGDPRRCGRGIHGGEVSPLPGGGTRQP